MAKDYYKVPTSLDMSYFDIEIALTDDSGAGLKPIAIRTIGFWVASGMILFIICTKSFLASCGPLWIGLFCAVWLAATWFYAKTDDTGRMGAMLIPSVVRYMPKSARRLTTRTNDNAYDFMRICGISADGIDKRGTIYWEDGTYGAAFRIVGSASILLFEEDKNAILNHVARFYTKIDKEVELIFDTTKEAQKVNRQLDYTRALFANRDIKDLPGLNKLYRERYDVLNDYVGKRFVSIHQYMFVKADTLEHLERFISMFQDEVSSSTQMFKQVQIMKPADIYEYMGKTMGREQD